MPRRNGGEATGVIPEIGKGSDMARKISSYAVDGNATVNALLKVFGAKNDATLARGLGVAPSVICKIRSGAFVFGATLLVTVLRKLDLTYKQAKDLFGLV